MTKEIIIDGVDVAGCCYYESKNDTGEWCDLTCTRDNAPVFRCEKMPNCYYKQLKRLEQENNLLKQTLKDKNFAAIVEENERLKHKIETILKRKKDNCTCEDCYNEGLWEGMAIGSYEEVVRLKHTLQEIKEIAENREIFCENCSFCCDEFTCDDCGYIKILQKITKAEEE